LLVEDDPATRKALGKILSRHGLDVLLARNLAEANTMIENDPEYVVLDLMLPDGDGIILLRAIREAGKPIRVAVTTGSVQRARIESVRLLNPEVLLFKPIVLGDLFRGLGINI
jgi:DNA-binding response OmpR family regulator